MARKMAIAKHNDFDIKRGGCYRVVEPKENDPEDSIRLIDESGEDYLYPRDKFDVVENEWNGD